MNPADQQETCHITSIGRVITVCVCVGPRSILTTIQRPEMVDMVEMPFPWKVQTYVLY